MKIDKKIIKELTQYLDEFNLTELEYTEKDTKIKVSKNNISLKEKISTSKNLDTPSEASKISVNTKSGKEANYFTNNWNSISRSRTRCEKIC